MKVKNRTKSPLSAMLHQTAADRVCISTTVAKRRARLLIKVCIHGVDYLTKVFLLFIMLIFRKDKGDY